MLVCKVRDFLLGKKTITIVVNAIIVFLICIYLYCRVEAESSGREEDSPIVVLFTGISQSVVKNLKQVYNYLYMYT